MLIFGPWSYKLNLFGGKRPLVPKCIIIPTLASNAEPNK
jgi:hypothetical protein